MRTHRNRSPLLIIPDGIAATVFASKQYQRKKLNAATLQAIQNRMKNSADNERHHATVAEYFQGFWDMLIEIFEVSFLLKVDSKLYYHRSKRRVSTARQSSYEIILIVLYSLFFCILPLIIRVSTAEFLFSSNGCTGCVIAWEDLVIVNTLSTLVLMPLGAIFYIAGKYDIPDPLMYIIDVKQL
jgi:hypothetical protein